MAKAKLDSIKSLNTGVRAANNLMEVLQVDFAVLAKSLFPKLTTQQVQKIKSFQKLGILKRMEETSRFLGTTLKSSELASLHKSASDTARGWLVFIIGQKDISLAEKMLQIKPFADDLHFGVREWAWMAIRRDIMADLPTTIRLLKPWTQESSPRLRRFVTEATRPRGVWAPHIPKLKTNPEVALSLLEPLRSDVEKYVQDSVANWLNDASKDQPQWVKKICMKWEKESPTDETLYITKRAQRTLVKVKTGVTQK